MKTVELLVFRYLTHADMFNIYKPSGMEEGGGGQSYIDFPVARVALSSWRRFFRGAPAVTLAPRAKGPSWEFLIHSIGGFGHQQLTIYQRRVQSVCIASQKITSRNANRVRAWHPENGFPEPDDPEDRINQPSGVVIFIVRTANGEFWAGWFQGESPCRTEVAEEILREMLNNPGIEGYAGFINCADTGLLMDEATRARPFLTRGAQPGEYPLRGRAGAQRRGRVEEERRELEPARRRRRAVAERPTKSDDEILAELFADDMAAGGGDDEATRRRIQTVRVRNTRAVQGLKRLYRGRCQITGDRDAFVKRDGTPYSEAHHLVPLGQEGDDSPYNIIIVSPLIHRMLHYADVVGVELQNISADHTLEIRINGEPLTIRWHPRHAAIVRRSVRA